MHHAPCTNAILITCPPSAPDFGDHPDSVTFVDHLPDERGWGRRHPASRLCGHDDARGWSPIRATSQAFFFAELSITGGPVRVRGETNPAPGWVAEVIGEEG
jgi:hypothetical protein